MSKFLPLGLYIPDGVNSTLQSCINAAAINPKGAVWIPASYTGTDTYTNPSSVPVFDMRGSGSADFAGGVSSSDDISWTGINTFSQAIVAVNGVKLDGSSSGQTIIQATATASGTATLPANTGTIAELNLAQNWTALQEFSSGISADGSHVATIPSVTDTLVGKATTDTFSNKTIDTAAPNTIKINGNILSATAGSSTITLPNSTDTVVARNTTDTLTNKTIDTASPNTIKINGNTLSATAGSATVTVPNSTDTLVGKATTDTLTNKTYDTAGTGNVFKINTQSIAYVSGNTSKVATVSGSLTSGNAHKSDANGNTVDAGVSFSAASGIVTVVSQTPVVNVTPVTVSTNTTSDQNLMAGTVSANTMNSVGKTLKIFGAGVYTTPVANLSTITVKVKLGSLTLATFISSANPGTVTNNPWNFTTYVTTQTAGSSAVFETHGSLTIDLGATPSLASLTFMDVNTAVSSTLDSTSSQTLQITVAFSSGSASNSATQRQLIGEFIN